jgi:predicted permease
MNPVIRRSALGWGSIKLIGRLNQGISIEQARAEMAVLFQSAIQLPDAGPFVKQMKFFMQPAGTGLSTPIRRMLAAPLLVLMPTVSLVLLIACTNVATLLLARGVARQHEISVRACLGAGRFRLVRQALTESLLLSAVGTLGGVFFANFAARGLLRMFTSGREIVGLPVSVDALARPDLHVLVFTSAIALLTALLFGVAPAMHALSTTPAPALQSVRASESKPRRLFGRALVISQVALSVALLSSAALFVGHLLHLRNLDLGFRRDRLLLFTLDTAHSGYEAAQLSRLSQELLKELEAVPGVNSATLSGMTPMQGPGASSIATVEGRPDNHSDISVNYVAPNYFKTYGTPLLAGRDFSIQDRDGTPVALINQALARHFFGIADPVGSHVNLSHTTARRDDKSYEVIGVVGDAKYNDIQQPAPRTIYLNALQENRRVSQLSIRTNLDPAAVASGVRQSVISVMKTVPILRVRTMTDQIDASIVPERLIALLSGAFGILGAVVVAIGVYGLLAHTVSRRTSEIGVRIALGATRGRVIRMVLRDALAMVGIGLLMGAPLVFWCQRIAASLLPNLLVNNVTAIACGAMGMMTLVALFAAYIPARRAAHVDPLTALRYE